MIYTTKEIKRGDSKTYRLEVTDTSGAAVDLTGATIWYTLKEKRSDSDAEAKIQLSSDDSSEINIYDPMNGKARIYIQASHTYSLEPKDYPFDIQVKFPGGSVNTVILGFLKVHEDVTRTYQ